MARGRRNDDPDTDDDTGPYPTQYPADSGTQPAAPARRVRPVKRARLGVVVLTVLLGELVIIGAGLNQAVAKHLASYAANHPMALPGRCARSLLVLRWRFASENGHSDLWHAELITVGLVLLLGILLVPLVVHGPVSWLRAFAGTWFTVTVSVPVAVVAALVLSDLEESRDLALYVVPGTASSGLSVPTRIGDATFGPVVSYAFVAGLALGFVLGLLVALVALSTRRADPVPVAVTPEQGAAYPEAPQPFFGDEGGAERRAGYASARYADTHPYAPSDRRAESETTTFPAAGGGYSAGASNDTTALPRVGTDRPPAAPPAAQPDAGSTAELPRAAEAGESEGERTQAWPAQPEPSAAPDDETGGTADDGGEQTAAFPLPPDDDDLDRNLGHHPDD